jgi:hypothetical protein
MLSPRGAASPESAAKDGSPMNGENDEKMMGT